MECKICCCPETQECHNSVALLTKIENDPKPTHENLPYWGVPKECKDLTLKSAQKIASHFRNAKDIQSFIGKLIDVHGGASRIKAAASILKKSQKKKYKDAKVNSIEDIVGIRIVVNSRKDFCTTISSISYLNPVFANAIIQEPTHLGYSAIHLLFKSPKGGLIELQIMTKAMSLFVGYCHDRVYKKMDKFPKNSDRKKIGKYCRNVSKWLQGIKDEPTPSKFILDNDLHYR